MKVLYGEIKKLVPGLKAKPAEVGRILTMTGFMMDGFEETEYFGKKDYLLSFEVRQNRADCFSVIGLAREVAASFGMPLKLPKVKPYRAGVKKTAVGVKTASGDVKRILAAEFADVANADSPSWLKEFLRAYGMNSKSLLVDLSNYVMILTGYPSHLLDLDKVTGTIFWSRTDGPRKIVTLDGSTVDLPGNQLVINDERNILALAGVIGGKDAEISDKTAHLFAEMAVYDGAVIRKDSRASKTVTEASSRLEKDIDPEGAKYAFDLLVSLILQCGKGKLATRIFEYYPKKNSLKKIVFDLALPADFAGIAIDAKKALAILRHLGFGIGAVKNNRVGVVVPAYRTDVESPEDLVEEVVRIYGYGAIPAHEIPVFPVVPDITPRRIALIDEARRTLVADGFDEILSIPLGELGSSGKEDHRGFDAIVTENAVNENYPELRRSLAGGLVKQAEEYQKKNVSIIEIFEVGKVFGKAGGKYFENESLGLFLSGKNDLSVLKGRVENILRRIGIGTIDYAAPKIVPAVAHPRSCWSIVAEGKVLGMIYKCRPGVLKTDAYFAEMDISSLEAIRMPAIMPVVELSDKLVVLDMNVAIEDGGSIREILARIRKMIGEKNIWSIAVVDKYSDGKTAKYTLRISYTGLDDQSAKAINAKILSELQERK